MKNYKVRATRNFTDALENTKRVAGEEFECTKERYEFLSSKNNAVELIEIIEEEKPIIEEEVETTNEEVVIEEPVEEPKPKKKTTKKKSK